MEVIRHLFPHSMPLSPLLESCACFGLHTDNLDQLERKNMVKDHGSVAFKERRKIILFDLQKRRLKGRLDDNL